MADLYVGSQGSGKSARAVREIVNGLEEYTRIYTNIDVKEHDKVYKLRFAEFVQQYITPLYNSYKNNELYGDINLVNDLIRLMELDNVDYNSFSLLVVVDEASNYLKEKNIIYRWFIEYHRHLNIDLILITQLYTSIHTDNRIYTNIYEAWSKSRQVLPLVFLYTHYLGSKIDSEHKRGITFIWKSKKYLDFYVSGRQIKQKNVIAFPMLLLVLTLLAVVFGFKWFFANSSLTADKPIEQKEYVKHVNSVPTIVHVKDVNNTNLNTKIFSYFVDSEYLYCENNTYVPLVLVPKNTVLIQRHGYGYFRYFYNYELEACKQEIEEHESMIAKPIQKNIDDL